MNNLLNRAKATIDKARNILIVPANPFEQESYSASLTLCSILRNIGKNVNLSYRDIPRNLPLFENDFDQYLKKTSLIINTPDKQIKEIYYEKDENKITIDLFLPNNEEINLEDIEIKSENGFVAPDAVITIGVETLASLEDELDENFKIFYEKPIINIDNHAGNDAYGQINLLDRNKTLANIISDLSNILKEKREEAEIKDSSGTAKNIPEMPRINEVASFIQQKEKYAPARRASTDGASSPSRAGKAEKSELLERALQKIEISQNKKLPFICLSAQDFKQTGATIKDLPPVMEYFKNNPRTKYPVFLFVWEDNSADKESSALLYSENPSRLTQIRNALGGAIKGNGLLITNQNKSLLDLKEKIINAI